MQNEMNILQTQRSSQRHTIDSVVGGDWPVSRKGGRYREGSGHVCVGRRGGKYVTLPINHC